MSEKIEEIYSILLTRPGFVNRVFEDVRDPKPQKQGQEMVGECPFCHKRKLYYNTTRPVWNCYVCGEGGDWLKYLVKLGYTFPAALGWLAGEAGVELDGFNREAYERKQRRASLLEDAQRHFIETLWSPAGSEVLAYLRGRGYSDADIRGMQLGAYTSQEALRAHLARLGYSEQEMDGSGLLKWPWAEWHKVTLLWTDAAGQPIGLQGRAIVPEEQLPSRIKGAKYWNTAGMQKDQGLPGLSAARGAKRVIVVEGGLAALYLSSRGWPAVATGGTSLSEKQVRALEWAGVKEVVLAFDNDPEGQGGRATVKALRSLHNSSLRAYVATWSDYKGPDDLVLGAGPEAFQAALDNPLTWSQWLPWHICQQHDIHTAVGLERALEELSGILVNIQDGLDRKLFREALLEATGLAEEDLLYRMEQARQRAAQEAQRRATEATLAAAGEKLREGNLRGAEEALEGGLLQIRASRGVEEPEPYLLADWQEELATLTAGRRIGWESLEPTVRIPAGALMYIVGRPGQGKTTTLLNMLVKQLQLYPTDRFYFFSYEESRARLMIKLTMILAGVTLQAESNFEAYLYYLREPGNLLRLRPGQREHIQEALATLDEWTRTGRLVMVDKPYPAEDLAAVIGLVGSRREAGAVFIDYVQKIPVREAAAAAYLDIKHRSQLLLEQAVAHDLAVIAGAQANRASETRSNKDLLLSDIREGGDLEQDANTILGIRAPELEAAEAGGQQSKQAHAELTLQVMKNRGGGGVGRKFELDWHRPTLRLVDKPAARSPRGW